MRTPPAFAVAFLVVALPWGRASRASSVLVGQSQDEAANEATVEIIGRFGDQDWHKRMAAFDDLISVVVPGAYRGRTWLIGPSLADFFRTHPRLEDPVRVHLIALLGAENDYAATSQRLSEEYTNYFGDVIGAVASLHDPRSIPALLADIGSGNMATCGLAALGFDALDPVLSKLSDVDPIRRQGAVRTLAHMLEPSLARFTDAHARERMERALIGATADKEYGIRISAIQGLSHVRSPEVERLLTFIATHDPFYRPGGTQPVYVVRNAAAEALRSEAPPSCQ